MITVQRDQNSIELAGVLNHASVATVLSQSADWFAGDALSIGLQGISHSNSAGLALLLEWQKIARQKQVSIQYHNVPEQLLTIARAYGVDQLLSIRQ